MNILWLLNPDAELELSHIAQGKTGPYAPNRATAQAVLQRKDAFSELVGADPSIFCFEKTHATFRDRRADTLAVLWCPTPYAQARVRALELQESSAPLPRVLIEANDKTLLTKWELPCVPGRGVVSTVDEALELLSRKKTLRFKRPFGCAGRGHRKLTHHLTADDRRWLNDSLVRHSLVAEPELENPRLFSLHMLVDRTRLLMGKPVGFTCDAFGALSGWNEETLSDENTQLVSSRAARSAEMLLNAGYFGPLSIDFAQDTSGAIYALDLNARFSLGHRRGLPNLRDELFRWHRETAL